MGYEGGPVWDVGGWGRQGRCGESCNMGDISAISIVSKVIRLCYCVTLLDGD